MTKSLNKELKRYYHEIGKALTCDNRKKKNIVSSIKNSVEYYISDNPNSTFDDILNHFGSPKDIADEYYNNESTEEISTEMKKGKKVWLCIIVTLGLALLIYVVIVVTALIHDMNGSGGFYTPHVITEISQTDN